MANPRPTNTYAGSTQHPVVDRPEDLALDVPHEEAPGADEVDSAALSLEIDDDCDPPEDYREYGDERRAYANSVGMRLWEKI